jgi:hypothetical protein
LSGDEILLERLRRMLDGTDAVPARVREAARAAWSWRNLDAELAALVSDSLTGTAAVRGRAARLLTYEAGELVVEIEVTETGAGIRLVGQIVPPQPAEIRIERPEGDVDLVADELGRFAVADLTHGPLRLACKPVNGSAVCTEWVIL